MSDSKYTVQNRFWQGIIIVMVVTILSSAIVSITFLLRPASHSYELTVPLGENQYSELEYGSKIAMADYNFFEEVRESFIDQKAHFISIDLNDMALEVYKNGQKELAVPVAAKGRMGSWWETPAGIYEIKSKARNHVTSFGGLHMPWSMQFHGNFFVHGWPYFPDGTPVAGSSSGGCVRLATENAKAVYDLVSVGMPILVHDSRTTDTSADFTYLTSTPDLNASHYLAVDLESNHTLLEQNHENKAPLSVLTHLLTALMVTEHINIKNNVRVPAGYSSDVSGVNPGSSYRVYDLLFPLMRSGSDTAARAFAHYRGEDSFLRLLQEQADSIGMQDSEIFEALSSGENSASPKDVFVLAKYLYNYRSFILDISSGRVNTSIYGSPRIQTENKNYFAGNGEFRGGLVLERLENNEPTAALAVFSMQFGDNVRPVAFVAMGSSSPAEDIEKMYEFVKDNYSIRTIDSAGLAEESEDGEHSSVLNLSTSNQRASILEAVPGFRQ